MSDEQGAGPGARSAEFGVGDQVIVKHDAADGSRDWAGEPSGEIVASASNHGWELIVGEMSADFSWVVSFDEPQYLKDGSGPFTETTVEARRLVHAPTSEVGAETLEPAPAL